MKDEVSDSLRIARVEVIRSWRWLTGDWRRAVVSGFFFVSLMSTALMMSVLLYFIGILISSGTEVPSEVLDTFRVMVNFGFVYLSFIFSGRVFSEKGSVGNRDLLLTTVSPASVVAGTLMADFLRALAIAGPFVFLLATAFGLGLGSVFVFPAVVISFFLLVALSVAFGYAAGFALKLILGWLPSQPWILKWSVRGFIFVLGVSILLVLSLAFIPLPESARTESIGALSYVAALDFETPLTVYADAFFVGMPFGSPNILTAAAFLSVAAAVPVFVGVATRLAPRIWYSEAAVPSKKASGTKSRRPPGVLSGTKTLRTTWWLLHRGRRNFMRFVHLVAPLLLFLIVLLPSVVAPSSLPVLGPPVLFLAGAYLSGAAFGLNQLGEEGEVLHVLVTSLTPGRCFVRARVLAGLFVGLPLVLGSLVFAPFSPIPLIYHLLLVVFGIYFSVCCSAIAVGLGTSFPRFESVHPEYDLLPPTTFASTSYLGAVFVPGLLALVLFVLPLFLSEEFFVVQVIAAVGLVVLAAVTGAVGYSSYMYSIRRFDSYTFD